MPVLLNGLQEEPVTDALLTATTCQQRGRHLEDLVHRLPAKHTKNGCKTKQIILRSSEILFFAYYTNAYGCLKSDRGDDFVVLFTGFILQLQKKNQRLFFIYCRVKGKQNIKRVWHLGSRTMDGFIVNIHRISLLQMEVVCFLSVAICHCPPEGAIGRY